ncbi:cupin [Cohnella sp.]|uniref:cupin n=1 Tax=Cohnella sp. TaxID=1883426 RepID=UPI003567B2EB
MRIYNFSKELGKNIQAFNSNNLFMTRILKDSDHTYVGCMHIEENGEVGLHQATIPQLLLIVNGEGWVKGNERIEYRIQTGYAVFWEAEEWHETRTDKGLTAIIIESKSMNLDMKEEEWNSIQED